MQKRLKFGILSVFVLVTALVAVSPEFSSSVTAEFGEESHSHSAAPSSPYMRPSSTTQLMQQMKMLSSANVGGVSISRVSRSEVEIYKRAHALVYSEAKFGTVTQNYLIQNAKRFHASKVLVAKEGNRRNIYYFLN